jgi:uncharacterized protein
VVAVLGNHDCESGLAEEVKQILKRAGVRLLDGQACEIGGVAFVGVKGFPGGFGPRMLASFGEASVKALVADSIGEAMRLENAMRAVHSGRAVVVLHYAPVLDTVEGEPLEIVHGHAHRGRYQGRTPAGAPVYTSHCRSQNRAAGPMC